MVLENVWQSPDDVGLRKSGVVCLQFTGFQYRNKVPMSTFCVVVSSVLMSLCTIIHNNNSAFVI